jgi:RNA-binding protein
MASDLREKRKLAKALSPVVNVGKNGAADSVIAQIKKALRKREMIKVKLLRSSLLSETKSALAQRIADSTGTKVISLVGNKLVLYKEKR